MLSMLINSFRDFKTTYKKYLLFELIHTIITSFLFVPLISYIVGRMLVKMGSRSLINKDVFKTALSYEGILGVIMVSILFITFIFIEYGILIIISQKRYFQKEISILNSFVTVLKKIPKMLSIGILPLVILLLFLTPFIELPISSVLAKDLNVPLYVKRRILDSYRDLFIYFSLLFSLGYIFLRLIFTFHLIIIENKSTLKSIGYSWKLTDNREIKILIRLILFNGLIIAIGFLFISSITFITNKIGTVIISRYLEELFITFSGYISYILISLLAPTNVIFITRLYYNRMKDVNDEVKDNLIPYKNELLKKVEYKFYKLLHKRRYTLIFVLIISLVITFSINYFLNKDVIYMGRNISIAAHRSNAVSTPENSLSGIRTALEKNIEFIEIDVQLTKDGEVVVYHDISLRRLTGQSHNISELTYKDLSEIDIGIGYSNEFEGERIPTLDQVLKEVKGKSKLIVELKSYGAKEELVENVVKTIEKNNMTKEVYIQSFDNRLLRMIRKINKNINIGQVMYIAAGDLSYLDVDFYAIEKSMLSDRLVQHARKNNREVWVWTVNEEDNMREVLSYDIDGIITDYPLRVKEIIDFDLQ